MRLALMSHPFKLLNKSSVTLCTCSTSSRMRVIYKEPCRHSFHSFWHWLLELRHPWQRRNPTAGGQNSAEKDFRTCYSCNMLLYLLPSRPTKLTDNPALHHFHGQILTGHLWEERQKCSSGCLTWSPSKD